MVSGSRVPRSRDARGSTAGFLPVPRRRGAPGPVAADRAPRQPFGRAPPNQGVRRPGSPRRREPVRRAGRRAVLPRIPGRPVRSGSRHGCPSMPVSTPAASARSRRRTCRGGDVLDDSGAPHTDERGVWGVAGARGAPTPRRTAPRGWRCHRGLAHRGGRARCFGRPEQGVPSVPHEAGPRVYGWTGTVIGFVGRTVVSVTGVSFPPGPR